MGSDRSGSIKRIILLCQGGRDFDQEGNSVNIEVLLGEGDDPFKLVDVIFHRWDTMEGAF